MRSILRAAVRGLGAAGVILTVAVGAAGCLSDDTQVPSLDAALPVLDGSVPPLDASGQVDGAPRDAWSDAPAATEAGPDGAPPSSASLVPGGSFGRGKSYGLNGTVGPATAPVLTSPKYRLVGGLATSTQSKK